jgi:hypothetical protein
MPGHLNERQIYSSKIYPPEALYFRLPDVVAARKGVPVPTHHFWDAARGALSRAAVRSIAAVAVVIVIHVVECMPKGTNRKTWKSYLRN